MTIYIKKLIFALIFIVFGFLSVSILHGYRYSFSDLRVEKHGVLYLEGTEKEITFLREDNLIKRVSLPYLDLDMPLGVHNIELLKAGYKTFHLEILSDKENAAIAKVEFTPSDNLQKIVPLQHLRIGKNGTPYEVLPETQQLFLYGRTSQKQRISPIHVVDISFLDKKQTIIDITFEAPHSLLLETSDSLYQIHLPSNETTTIRSTLRNETEQVPQISQNTPFLDGHLVISMDHNLLYLSHGKQTQLLSQVQSIIHQVENFAYIQTVDGNIWRFDGKKVISLITLPSNVLDVLTKKDSQYLYITTEDEILHCEKLSLEHCTNLHSFPGKVHEVYYNDDARYFSVLLESNEKYLLMLP